MRYAARVFILYLASWYFFFFFHSLSPTSLTFSSANDVASSGKRSTIQGKDVLKAIDEIDFSAWRPTLEKLLSGPLISDCLTPIFLPVLLAKFLLIFLIDLTISLSDPWIVEHNSALAKKKSEKKAGGIDENVDENDDDDDNDDDKDEMDEDDNNNVQDEKEKDGDDVEMKDADV